MRKFDSDMIGDGQKDVWLEGLQHVFIVKISSEISEYQISVSYSSSWAEPPMSSLAFWVNSQSPLCSRFILKSKKVHVFTVLNFPLTNSAFTWWIQCVTPHNLPKSLSLKCVMKANVSASLGKLKHLSDHETCDTANQISSISCLKWMRNWWQNTENCMY